MKKTGILGGLLFLLAVPWVLAGLTTTDSPFSEIENTNITVELEIPPTYQEIEAGKEIWLSSKVINRQDTNRRDAVLAYQLIDGRGQVQLSKSETVAIETQSSFVNRFSLPSTLKPGTYQVRLTVQSSLGISTATDNVQVIAEQVNGHPYSVSSILLIALVGLVYLRFDTLKGVVQKYYIRQEIKKMVKREDLSE